MTTALAATPTMTAESLRAAEVSREISRIKESARIQGEQQLAQEQRRRETLRSLISRDARKTLSVLRARCDELARAGAQVRTAREAVEGEIAGLRKSLDAAVREARTAQGEAAAHKVNAPALSAKANRAAAEAEQRARDLGLALEALAKAYGTIVDIGKAITIARAAVNEFAIFESYPPGK